jgi:3'(2'), 5'-bisphosphate nucleotidase
MHQRELEAATEIVAKVCGLTAAVQQQIVAAGESLVKDDRSPVTIADLAAQAVVSRLLAERFPGDPLMAEEDTSPLAESTFMTQRVLTHAQTVIPDLTVMELIEGLDRGGHTGDSGRYWVLDPIDGTKGFLRGDQYAIALALVEEGQVVVGVLGCPNLEGHPGEADAATGRLFTAVRGQRAATRPVSLASSTAISVDGKDDFSAAVICESFEAAHAAHSVQGRIAERLGVGGRPYRIDSQCKYAVVARGQASIYLRLPRDRDYREKVWDHAAGSIIVEEAGGRVTDLAGVPLDFSHGRRLGNGNGIVCSNGLLHDRVLEACRIELG